MVRYYTVRWFGSHLRTATAVRSGYLQHSFSAAFYIHFAPSTHYNSTREAWPLRSWDGGTYRVRHVATDVRNVDNDSSESGSEDGTVLMYAAGGAGSNGHGGLLRSAAAVRVRAVAKATA
jgi:hypothetical protein